MKELIGSLISFFGVLITGMLAIHSLKEQKWSENVSKERMKWLVEFRNEVSRIASAVVLLNSKNGLLYNNSGVSWDNEQNNSENTKSPKSIFFNNQRYVDIIIDAERARWSLYTRINTNSLIGNEYNYYYKKALLSIDFTSSDINDFDIKSFMELTNHILEQEWQKVKKEAKGEVKK